MKMRLQIFSSATLLILFALGASNSLAVDNSRATSQASKAPAWTQPFRGFNVESPRRGGASFNSTPSGAIRSRTRDRFSATQPNQNRPSQPSLSVTPSYQPPYSPSPGQQNLTPDRWRLGIFPQDTDTGVQITEVVRGSAAERAGLEVNDRIVSVHGYQIGYVDGTLYDIGQELERHADENGWVRLLVQNNRDGQLLNLPVQLEPRQKTISGTITYRERSALPRDAVATVELREILRSDLRPITIARQTISPTPRVPIPFTLQYDPNEVTAGRRYVLNATISAGGRQLYATRQDVPVLGGKPSNNLQLLVESATVRPGGGSVQTLNEQLAQVTRWFREYLGREPRAQELYVWESHLARGGSLADAQLQILSTPEFYYQANGDDRQYIYRMFQLVTQRQPMQQEVSQWLNRLRFHSRLRSELAKEFLAMANAQANRTRR